jgi:hypothetical protein
VRCTLDGRHERAAFECSKTRVRTQMLVSLAGLSHTRRKPYGRQCGRLSTLPLDGGADAMCECGEVGAREHGLDEDGMWMVKWRRRKRNDR